MVQWWLAEDPSSSTLHDNTDSRSWLLRAWSLQGGWVEEPKRRPGCHRLAVQGAQKASTVLPGLWRARAALHGSHQRLLPTPPPPRRCLHQRRFPMHNISSHPPQCASLPSPLYTRPQNHALIISHV